MSGAYRPRVLVIVGLGINADRELAEAFRRVGGDPSPVHALDILSQPDLLDAAELLALPGGFSFGDHLGSGLVLAKLLRQHLRPAVDRLLDRGVPVIGICNGFQVLVKSGLLPGHGEDWRPRVSLVHNDRGRFVDRWVRVRAAAAAGSGWIRGIDELDLPVRHGEGRFVYGDKEARRELSDLVAFRYAGHNPNGSEDAVAGMVDPTGRVLGMMPHPEAYLAPENHPGVGNLPGSVAPKGSALGIVILENGVHMAREAAS